MFRYHFRLLKECKKKMLSTLKLYFVIFRKVYKEIRLYDNSPICSQKWMDAKKNA